MKKTVLSTVFSCILSLFLAVCLLGGCLCVFVRDNICAPDALLGSAEKSGFYTELYEEIKYKWENLLSITGIMDTEPFVALMTPEQVAADARLYLQNSYTGAAALDTEALKTALEEKVRDYAYSNNIHATPESELEQNIRDLVDACMADYIQAVQLPLLPKLLGTVSAFYGYLDMAAPILGAAALVLLVFLFFLQRKREETLYYTAISTATVAVLLLGLSAIAAYFDVVNRLPFEVSAMKTLVASYLQHILDGLCDIGWYFLAGTGVLVLAYAAVLLVRYAKKRTSAKGEETLDHSIQEDTAG